MEVNYSVPVNTGQGEPSLGLGLEVRSGGVETGEDDIKPENGSLAKY